MEQHEFKIGQRVTIDVEKMEAHRVCDFLPAGYDWAPFNELVLTVETWEGDPHRQGGMCRVSQTIRINRVDPDGISDHTTINQLLLPIRGLNKCVDINTQAGMPIKIDVDKMIEFRLKMGLPDEWNLDALREKQLNLHTYEGVVEGVDVCSVINHILIPNRSNEAGAALYLTEMLIPLNAITFTE